MPIDVTHVREVIARAASCGSGMVEVALDSLDFEAVRLAVRAGHLSWVANGAAQITHDGRVFLAPTLPPERRKLHE